MNDPENEGQLTPKDAEWLGRMSPSDPNPSLEIAEQIIYDESNRNSLEKLKEVYKKYKEAGEGDEFIYIWRIALADFDSGNLHPNSLKTEGNKINSRTFEIVRKFLSLIDKGEL